MPFSRKGNPLYADNWQVVFSTDMEMADKRIEPDFVCYDLGASATTLSVVRTKEDISVILQRSYKPAMGAWVITAQAGTMKKRRVGDGFVYRETPAQASRREVGEESGAVVQKLWYLGVAYRYGSKLIAPEHLFLALVEPPEQLTGDEAEGTEPFMISWEECKEMVMSERDRIDPVLLASNGDAFDIILMPPAENTFDPASLQTIMRSWKLIEALSRGEGI